MLTYTGQKDIAAKLTKDQTSTNKDFLGILINQHAKRTVNRHAFDFTEQLDESKTTTADTVFYNLPVDYHKLLMRPYVTVGSIRYPLQEVISRKDWDRLQSVSQTSDIPTHFLIFAGQLGIYPTPSSGGNTISIPYRQKQTTMVFEDHTTGNVTDIANGATTVTGSGTSWNSSMVGKYLRITATNADPTGDHEWYKIASVTNATTLELVKSYEGETISGGSLAYTIGEMGLIPDGYEMAPVYRAVQEYYIGRGERGEADRYKELAEETENDLINDRSNKTSGVSMEDDVVVEHPENYPKDLS